MLAVPTVFVLGAGASLDFGLPSGATLAKDIAERLHFELDLGVNRGDPSIFQAINKPGGDGTAFAAAANEISEALPYFKSIDDCLHSHASNKLGVLAGKMAIARSISLAEQGSVVSKLWSPDPRVHQPARDAIGQSWAGALVRMLVTGRRREEYRDVFRDVILVSFNYDRCIESILFHLIQPALNIGQDEAAESMAALRVFHPYGSLGPLKLGSGAGVPFGSVNADLQRAAEGLFVYTEPRDQPDDLLAMQELVKATERIVFMGFGYHAQNMGILRAPGEIPPSKRILGTVCGEPQPSVEMFQSRMGTTISQFVNPTLVNQTCAQFMSNFGATLSG